MKESKRLVTLAIAALVIVNIALAAVLYARVAEPRAYAQTAGRPEVLAISARYNTAGAILMLDSASGQLVLVRPDPTGTNVKALDRHNVADDVARMR